MLEELLPQLTFYVVMALLVGLFAGLAYMIKKGKELIEAKIGTEKFNSISGYAAIIVRYLMQSPIFSDWDGSQKKEYAMNWLLSTAEKLKLPLTKEFADKLVEAAYSNAKKTINNVFPGSIE